MKETIFLNEDNLPKGGRLHCKVCGQHGFYLYKYRRGSDTKKWFDKLTCLNCGSFEKRYCNTGEIFEQNIKEK